MNKFLITLVAALSLVVANIASADVKISGVTGVLAGLGDKVDGGITSKFNRFGFSVDATMDNGWTYGGSFTTEIKDNRSFALPTSNSVSIGTDMATISLGATGDAVTSTIPRIGAMVPGGGHDAGYQFLYGGDSALGAAADGGPAQVSFAEAYYAYNSARINVALPAVNGFSVAASYTPALDQTDSVSKSRVNNDNSSAHGEAVHVGAAYTGEMDGTSYTIGVGSIMGNSQGNTSANTLSTYDNNDLSSFTAAIKVSMGNLTVGAHMYDNGDSFGAASDADKASNSGYTVAMEYAMGNMTLGAGLAHQENTRGTRAATNRATPAAATAGNVYEDTVTFLGVGYNMGGGVNSFIQYNSMSYTDGNHATTTDTDPSTLSMGITLGF
jgi:hypothetical protein